MSRGVALFGINQLLELIPQILVVNLVMELHFLGLHNGSEQTGAAVRRSFFEIGIAGFHVLAE
jgi:hypothetical protein